MGDRSLSRNSHEGVGSVKERQSKTAELLTGKPEYKASSRMAEKGEAASIEINPRVWAGPVAFVADGDCIVAGDGDEIRRWRVKDGKGIGQPMDAGSVVWSIAISRDGNWIVSGTSDGQVIVWDAKSHEKANQFTAHMLQVFAVDISPDGTRIATGSSDGTARVRSLLTGEQLLRSFKHDWYVVAVKFSPNRRFIATATWERHSVRVYDGRNGRLLVDTSIRMGSPRNQSLAWAGLGNELFALSKDGDIHCIDVATGTTLSKWAIHSNNNPRCIALASDGAFIAASANSSVSFWDNATPANWPSHSLSGVRLLLGHLSTPPPCDQRRKADDLAEAARHSSLVPL